MIPHIYSSVGYCIVYLIRVRHNLLLDRRNNLTLSFCTNPSFEVGGDEIFINQLNINIMKKILLFMLPLVALSFASCEKDNGKGEELSGDDIIQFEDAHFLHALLTVQEIEMYDAERDDYIDYMVDVDTNRDGQISVNEVQKVRGLSLYDYGDSLNTESFNVLSMPEIKYFTALEYLECGYNQLTTLNLNNNNSLTYLDCSENQLATLNLDKNAALIYLDCYDNQLTTLNVSGCPALTELECGWNQLTALDVSECPALKYIGLEWNQLTALDVSKNIALTDLGCSGSPLKSLDVSKNTALKSLYCIDNQLTSLDLSNNTALERLNCNNNQLTTLDLSNNTALTELSCENNPLTKLILLRDNNISDSYMQQLIEEYGDIIEYVE